jgi:hypothetical protein
MKKKIDTSKIALGFRPPVPTIKALTDKLSFGRYKDRTIQEIIEKDPGYILWMHDEHIAIIPERILEYAEESDTDQRLSEAMDLEFLGIDYYDFVGDD